MTRTWNITLNSNFETGAGIQLKSPEPGVVAFLAPWDASPIPLWFHFCLKGAKGWRVRFVLKNAHLCNTGKRQYKDKLIRPVMTNDTVTIKPSHRAWQRIPKKDLYYDEVTGSYSFTVRIQSDEVYLANCYPYGMDEWREFLSDFKEDRCLQAGTFGRSELGRSIPYARITEGKAGDKKIIWFFARNHAGESSGAWALEGTLPTC